MPQSATYLRKLRKKFKLGEFSGSRRRRRKPAAGRPLRRPARSRGPRRARSAPGNSPISSSALQQQLGSGWGVGPYDQVPN